MRWTRGDNRRSRKADRGLLRDQPTHQSGGDLVLDLPEHLLRDIERQVEGLAEIVQWGDRRIRRLAGIIVDARLYRTKAAVPGARSGRGIAADIFHRLAFAGRSRL